MTGKILNFVRYHNAFPVAISFLLLSVGGVMAASPEARDAVYSSEEKIVAINNGAILNVNLDAFDFNLKVDRITQDDVNYQIAYSYQTLGVVDGTWTLTPKAGNMTISKKSMVGRDLGLYVAEQLGQILDQERIALNETQKIERGNGFTPQVVVVEYSGLVGKMLDSEEKVFEGYTPVVEEVPPQTGGVAASGSGTQISVPLTPEVIRSLVELAINDLLARTEAEKQAAAAAVTAIIPGGAPTIEIQGANPAELSVGATYADLGALITGPTDADKNLGISYEVNGTTVTQIFIDTSASGTHTIVYKATNQAGQTGTATRTVIVGSGTPPEPEEPEAEEVQATTTPESIAPEEVATTTEQTATTTETE